MALKFCLTLPDEWGSYFIPDDNLLNFCSDMKNFFESHNYSNLDEFGFIPVITTESKKRRSLAWKEHIAFHRGYSVAAAYVYINSSAYKKATSFEKIDLFHKGIIRAVKMISDSIEFDYESFKEDYTDYWEKTKNIYEEWTPPRGRGRPRKMKR